MNHCCSLMARIFSSAADVMTVWLGYPHCKDSWNRTCPLDMPLGHTPVTPGIKRKTWTFGVCPKIVTGAASASCWKAIDKASGRYCLLYIYSSLFLLNPSIPQPPLAVESLSLSLSFHLPLSFSPHLNSLSSGGRLRAPGGIIKILGF